MSRSISAPPPPPFDGVTRRDLLARAAEQPFDVLVVGGGLVGAAVARDAALRGLRTALIDRGDLGEGATDGAPSVSSRWLHDLLRGRWLRFGRDAAERDRLAEVVAPHGVSTAWLALPAGTPLAALRVAAGRLAAGLPRTGRRSDEAVTTTSIDGARLALETVRSAHVAGAAILPYVELAAFTTERTRVRGVQAFDRLTGAELLLQARVVVNATGHWCERTRGLRGDRPRLTRLEKVVRVAVAARDESGAHRAWAGGSVQVERGRLICSVDVGTFEGDFDCPEPGAGEVELALQAAAEQLGRDLPDPSAAWVVLRPEPLHGPRGTSVVAQDADGLVTAAGGELADHRTTAARAVERLAATLREDGLHLGHCPTGAVPLPSSEGLGRTAPLGQAADAGLEDAGQHLGPDVAHHLLRTYGAAWVEVAERCVDSPELAERLLPGHPWIAAEVVHAVASDLALTLEDVGLRRLRLRDAPREPVHSAAPQLGARVAALLGWSPFDTARQVERFRAALQQRDPPA